MAEPFDKSEYEVFRESLVLRKFKTLLRNESLNANTDAETSCGVRNWWIAMQSISVEHSHPSKPGFHRDGELRSIDRMLRKGDAVWCLEVEDLWLLVTRTAPWGGFPAGKPIGWVPWDGVVIGCPGLLLKPLKILHGEERYAASEAVLPQDSCFWSVLEVELFLSSGGVARPTRKSAICRSSKRFCRAVRHAPLGVEYRVDETGLAGGVFSMSFIPAGALVELCPLHGISDDAFNGSLVLQKLAVRIRQKTSAVSDTHALALGFARLYNVSASPNLSWGYFGDGDVALWTVRDVDIGQELLVNFDMPPAEGPLFVELDVCGYSENFGQLRNLESSGHLTHGPSAAHGRGVFASRSYEVGELVESCPLTLLDNVGAEELISYRWGLENVDDREYFLPHGLGAMYNHFEPPHVRAKLDKARRVLEIYAEMPVKAGQEIFITYGAAYFDDDFGHALADYKAPLQESGA